MYLTFVLCKITSPANKQRFMKNLSLFKSIKFAFAIVLSVLFASKVSAQNPSFLEHNWYFGDSPYGLIFSKGNNQVDTVTNQNTSFGYGLGGGAVVTDQLNHHAFLWLIKPAICCFIQMGITSLTIPTSACQTDSA